MIVIVALVIVVLTGAGLAAYFAMRSPTAQLKEAEHQKKPANHGMVSFDPFVVNLADPGGQRFLRINVRLILAELEDAERIQKSEVLLMRLRSGILDLLTEQTADRMVTQDGKEKLRKGILDRSATIVEPTKVADVLFADLVVQF